MQENHRYNSITAEAGVSSTSDQKIIPSTISKKGAKALDLKAAIALYMTASPFGLLQQPSMLAFIRLLNPAYKAPERRRFSGDLLNQAYHVRKLVEESFKGRVGGRNG